MHKAQGDSGCSSLETDGKEAKTPGQLPHKPCSSPLGRDGSFAVRLASYNGGFALDLQPDPRKSDMKHCRKTVTGSQRFDTPQC